ncbi:MAG: rRNA maturation RNase YbeY [Acidobacteriota bacterium]
MDVDIRSSVSGSLPPARVRRILLATARAAGGGDREVSVLFCGDRRMAGLNRRWRRKNRSTDVLSFPVGERGARFLGDIVISVPYANRQARRRGDSPAREMDRLLVHGYLHLLGYDHETDDGEMDALESKVRARLGIAERP